MDSKELHDIANKLNKLCEYKKSYLLSNAQQNRRFETGDLNIDDSSFGNKFIERLSKANSKENSQKTLTKIVDAILYNMVNSEKIEFILHDDMAAIFCYLHLLNNDVFDVNGNLLVFNERSTLKPKTQHFSSFSKSHRIISIKEIKYDFINFISNIDCNYQQKNRYIDHLKSLYVKSNTLFKFNWLNNKNETQMLWAQSYITKNETFKNYNQKKPGIFNNQNDYHTLFPALFHSLNIHEAEKTLLLLNAKKAWGQVKHRSKIKKENKTTINLVLNKKTKKILKDIATRESKTMNSVIEELILSKWGSIVPIPEVELQAPVKDGNQFNGSFYK